MFRRSRNPDLKGHPAYSAQWVFVQEWPVEECYSNIQSASELVLGNCYVPSWRIEIHTWSDLWGWTTYLGVRNYKIQPSLYLIPSVELHLFTQRSVGTYTHGLLVLVYIISASHLSQLALIRFLPLFQLWVQNASGLFSPPWLTARLLSPFPITV